MAKNTTPEIGRRKVLSGLVGGVAAGLGGRSVAAASATDDEEPLLAEFDEGLDGWRTNGGNEIARVPREAAPTAIQSGTHGAEVTVRGDGHPAIENTERVQAADWQSSRHLLATVTPMPVEGTESSITFQFRLHHSAAGGNGPGTGGGNGGEGSSGRGGEGNGGSDGEGNGGRGGEDGKEGDAGGGGAGRRSNEKPVNVVESPALTVRPLNTRTLSWDLADVPEHVRENATRLEIAWYPTEHPPERGARGRAKGFDYRGTVLFDSVGLTADVTAVGRADFLRTWTDRQLEHEGVEDQVVETSEPSRETGTVVYGDGTELDYEFESVGEDRVRLTFGDDTFRFGEGWR